MGLFGEVQKMNCPCCNDENSGSSFLDVRSPHPGISGILICGKCEVWKHFLEDELWCFPIFGFGWLSREEFERKLKLRSFQ